MMLVISMLDFLSSTGMTLFGPWAVPATAEEHVAGARGTVTTCEVSGFFLQFSNASMVYTVFLALSFVLRVNFEFKEKMISKFIEIPALVFSVLCMCIIHGIVRLRRDSFNPMYHMPGWCWTVPYPHDCDDVVIECERGKLSRTVLKNGLTTVIAVPILFAVVLLCMTLIVCKVLVTELRVQRYDTGRDFVLTKETTIQSLLYMCVFVVTYGPIVIVDSLHYWNRYHHGYFFVWAVLAKLLTPLQGFFNALIYMRKRYKALFREGGTLEYFPGCCLCRYHVGQYEEGRLTTRTEFVSTGILANTTGSLPRISNHGTTSPFTTEGTGP